MGGPGSGKQWGRNMKSTTESYRALDIRPLRRKGELSPGVQSWRFWYTTREEPLDVVFILAGESSVRLCYRHHAWGAEYDVTQTVAVTWTPCYYGGSRPWFVCQCGQRVAILYSAGRSFHCRRCCDLTYASRREDVVNRRMRKARKIRERIGASADLQNPIGWKPPRMHWKTFNRLTLQARALEGTAFELTEAWLEQRRARSEKLMARADKILQRYEKRSSVS
jgi:hypothetical protein